jgi:two-component system sensor histidine kinase KdpD
MVYVDGSPASARAVRSAAELASALHAAFMAVVVDTPELARQPFDRQRDLQEAVDDAVDLGAELVRVEASDAATGLAQIAKARRATHLVLPYRERRGLSRLTEPSLADVMLGRMPNLELHIVASGHD